MARTLIIAGITSVLFNSVSRGVLKKESDSTVYVWIFECIRTLAFVALIPFDYRMTWTWHNGVILFLLGLSELLAIYCFAKMHSQSELSISSILTRLRVIVVPMLAFVFLGERLSLMQYIGIVIVFIGCIAVARNGKLRGTKVLGYTIGFVVIGAVSSVLVKAATEFASTSIVVTAFSIVSVIGIPILMKSAMERIRASTRILLRPTLYAAAFNVITMYTIVAAARLAPASLVNAVFQGVTSLAVVVGIVYFAEHEHKWLKLAAAAVTTVGIILFI